MQAFNFTDRAVNVLFLGAHCDDIEIGCGGTILSLVNNDQVKSAKWVVFTSDEIRKKEAEQCGYHFLEKVEDKEIIISDFKDRYLPDSRKEVKEYLSNLARRFHPDVIFTHYGQDLHQDHNLVSDLTWQTYRNSLIFEYEIPKYDGDLGRPNFYVPFGLARAREKSSLIMKHYKSQLSKPWLDEELLLGLMRLRGMESLSKGKYAEAFYLRKAVLQNSSENEI